MKFINSLKKIATRSKYKDVLFQRVFRDRKDLLELYNALNHTDYTDTGMLEITTLEDVIYLSMKNDLSFVIGSTMNLYEHQSSYNPNMPLRGLLYFGRLYEAYVKTQEFDIYGQHLVKLPMPQYVVFYNGRKNEPDEITLKLSEAFQPVLGDDEPVLECRARMININYGHNQALMNTCKRLHDYSYFINEIGSNLKSGLILNKAIRLAIDTCIENDILKDILEKQQSEVFSMLLTEYNKKLHDKTLRNEGREEARLEFEELLREKDSKLKEADIKLQESDAKLQESDARLQQLTAEVEALKAEIASMKQ